MHRYLRLIPSVLAAACLLYYVLPLAGAGPFWWRVEGVVQTCSDSRFWVALAFMSNTTDRQDVCIGWLW